MLAEKLPESVSLDTLLEVIQREGLSARPEYISKPGFAELLQVSLETVNGWQARHWQKGDQYIVIGHTTLIHYEGAMTWLRGHGHPASDQGSVVASISNSGDTASASTRKRCRATRTRSVTSPQR